MLHCGHPFRNDAAQHFGIHGATVLRLDNIEQCLRLPQTEVCQAIVIELDAEPSPNAPLLTAMRALKKRGIPILAYGSDIDAWPVRVRCLPLLAGATQLLDSSKRDFDQELSRSDPDSRGPRPAQRRSHPHPRNHGPAGFGGRQRHHDPRRLPQPDPDRRF